MGDRLLMGYNTLAERSMTVAAPLASTLGREFCSAPWVILRELYGKKHNLLGTHTRHVSFVVCYKIRDVSRDRQSAPYPVGI